MRFIQLLHNLATAAAITALAACSGTSTTPTSTRTPATAPAGNTVDFQLIRNATIKLDYAGTTFLIDPMLAAKGAYEGFPGTVRSQLRNPLVDLPIAVEEVLQADAVILTHLHNDHWDTAAKALLPRNMPIFVQNEEDANAVRADGFEDVRVLTESGIWFNGTHLYKTGGQHGTDAMYATPQLADILGQAMGIVFQRPGYKTTYVVGDTIWQPEIDRALARHQPDIVLVNAGDARLEGFDGAIIMGKQDMLRAYEAAPRAKVIAIHLEAVNHAMLSREELRDYIDETQMDTQRALVPDDGERYRF